jgi:hypothetical protein
MNGILFAGCSFTWGQGLYYYSDLKRIPTMEEWSFDYSLMTDALINFKDTVRYPRLVANHFKTFDVSRDTNGGSDEDSLQFIKLAFDIADRKPGSYDYLTRQRFKYDDISYVIFQTTQPYRSSFKFVYKNETYHMWPNPQRTKMVRIAKLESSGLYREIDNPIDIFSNYLNENNVGMDLWLKQHIDYVYNNIKQTLMLLEENGIKTKVLNWEYDYIDMMLNDDFFKDRYVHLEHENKKYNCISELFANVPNTMISKDLNFFGSNPPNDNHPSMFCQKIISDSIIKSIESDKLI